jgi:hypothetical protein
VFRITELRCTATAEEELAMTPDQAHSRRWLFPRAWCFVLWVVTTTAWLAIPFARASHQFQDVPDTAGYHDAVDFLVEAGITSGCSTNPPLYCPSSNVTRGQMALFIARQYDCPPGTIRALGECFDTVLRGMTTVYLASDACRAVGGRLSGPLPLRSLRGGNPLTLHSIGEWTENVYVNGLTFEAIIVSNAGGLTNVSAGSIHPYRCVFSSVP